MYGPEFGDCIGSESCTEFKSNVHAAPGFGAVESNRMRRRRLAWRQFPPPIPWNQPWTMRKYATDDGRLIIKEERIECQEYLRAERSNGRLLLNLVHLEDAAEDGGAGERENLESEVGGFFGEEIKGGDDPTAVETAAECWIYNGGVMSHCGGFAVTLGPSPLRLPLHT